MTDKTVRIVTLLGAAVMFAWAIAMFMGALHSYMWAVVPLMHSVWMFYYAWRGHKAMKAGKAPTDHSAAA